MGENSSQTQQQVYETLGSAPWDRTQTTVNTTSKTTRLSLQIQDTLAWQWQTTQSPSGWVNVQEGQSIQQAVDATLGDSGATLFASFTLPDLVPDPRQPPAGRSSLESLR